ncbi:EAL domain-containing protein [Vibrio sp. WXL103]|uniref:EAL domain-containing protein n=1 Tax=unclassified Vibrio TaxID=2614977 RepID=UPI003EC8202B
MNQTQDTLHRPTVGVIMPLLSGFYMGELSIALRLYARKLNINLVLIRSGESRNYDLPIGLAHLDALLVVLHSASHQLIDKAVSQGIPVISLGASYSPLPVEQMYSDQRQGVALLYDWLRQLGHQRIAFCGDLNVNDIRLRFKSFQAKVIEHHGRFIAQDFISVSDCSFAGGREGANALAQMDKACSAVICAADQNAIGMIQQLKAQGFSVPDDYAVVGVDNVFLGEKSEFALTTIDQNLEVLAQQALLRAVERIEGARFNPEVVSHPQSLVIRGSCGGRAQSYQRNGSRSVRQQMIAAEIQSPAELFESFYSQAKDGFNSILDAQSCFGYQFEQAFLAHCRAERYHLEKTLLVNHCQSTVEDMSGKAAEHVEDFPISGSEQHSVQMVIPIKTGVDDHFKLLSISDSQANEQSVGAYSMFSNYLDMLALFIERDSLLDTATTRQKSLQQILQQLKVVSNTSNDGIWDWDLVTNRLTWNSRLVDMLGIPPTGRTDIHCSELFEFIHHEDISDIEDKIHDHLSHNAPFKTEFRMHTVSGKYIWVQANGAAVSNSNGRAVRFIGSLTDITQQRKSAQKIHQMAYFDSLTGIANRRKIIADIDGYINTGCKRNRAVMLMDLNRFKLVNDTFGHHAGDALLRHVAKQLTLSLGDEQLFARLGGDEFLLFCDVSNRQQVKELTDQILRRITQPFSHGNILLEAQAAIGIAWYPDDGTSADELIKKADVAMYRAKQAGGNRAVTYKAQMDASCEDMIAMEHQLKGALKRNEVEVYYQPQIGVDDNQVVGVEALARWSSITFGDVPPHRFIHVAEQCGLMSLFGEYILNRVCQDLVDSDWLRGLERISINVSAKELVNTHFASSAIQTILNHQLPLSLFCFEITETAAITDYDLCSQVLEQLRNAGISLSLDDFGTGFSSLSLLKRLPLKEVKIDRSFIRDIVDGQANLDFVTTMILMGKSLGYRVVAEGVETEAHAVALKNTGVDVLQGFSYSVPRPLRELETRYAHQLAKCHF